MKDRSTLQADVVRLLLDLYGFSFGFQNCIISLSSFLHTSLGGQLSLQVRSRDAACRLDRLVVLSPFSLIMYIDIDIHRQGVKVHNE